MNNIKIITIIITLIIISIAAITPKNTEHLFGGGGGFPDVGGIARGIFNDLIRPVTNLINIIPNNAGVPDLVGLTKNLVRMEPYIKIVLTNIIRVNLTLQKVFMQLDKDVKNIKSVTPIIKKCIQRIEYCHQRLLNISKCAGLLGFMIKNKRPIFIIKATKLLMYNIMDTINYTRMSMRTTFIDLHNTNPPLWKVINGKVYKSAIVSILNYSKVISQNTNVLIQISSNILGNIKGFLNRPLVRNFDHSNLRGTIGTFETMLRNMKIFIITIPNIQLNMDYKIIYNITKTVVITSTIPPGKNLFNNRDYIKKNIKNHPYV